MTEKKTILDSIDQLQVEERKDTFIRRVYIQVNTTQLPTALIALLKKNIYEKQILICFYWPFEIFIFKSIAILELEIP